jgi:hypothetical protein
MMMSQTLPARADMLVSGLSWTAQGGRDRTAWVRQLVTYTETHPINVMDQHARAAEVISPRCQRQIPWHAD